MEQKRKQICYRGVEASGSAWHYANDMDEIITAGHYSVCLSHDNLASMGIVTAPCDAEHKVVVQLIVTESAIANKQQHGRVVGQTLVFAACDGATVEILNRTAEKLENGFAWQQWNRMSQKIEVGEVTSLDDCTESGTYNGVFTNGQNKHETFIMVVINNTPVAEASGKVRCISQFKYALGTDSNFSYKTRTGRGDDDIEWGDWVDLGAATTTDIQDGAITAQKLSSDVREKVETVPELVSGIADVRGFSILANFQVPVQTNVKVVGTIEFPAEMKSGTLLYLKYVQNYTVGNNGIRFYQNSAVAANLITPKRNGLIAINQDCDRIVVSTDCSVAGSIEIEVSKENFVVESKREIKILSIGNSFSQDAFCYLPYILQNIAPDIKLTFGIAYYSGASLQQHLQFMDDASAVYKLDKWSWDTYRWNAVNGQTLKQCLENEAWNIVVFQQSSSFSGDYSTVSPYLNPLIKRVGETLVKPVKLAWLLTPSNKMDFAESESFYNSISDVAERVLQETPIDMLFPCGTAIQNARHTTLQVLGDVGNLLHSSLHLQEGIPCLTEAYVAAMVVARSVGNNLCSVYGETSIVDSEWLNGKFIPGTHGSPVGSTFENIRIAQIAAIAAIKKPFEVTDISYSDDV